MLLRKAFPGYEQLRHHYYLHYLDGHKFLLPVAWVHRAFYRLGSRQRREDMLEMVRNGNAAIDKQDERLSGWGL